MEFDQQLLVLMFTDLVDSCALKVQLGDVDYAAKVADPHNTLFREILASIPGSREISYTGDGFVASFRRVSDAIIAALRFQHALRTHSWVAERARARIGIHLGEAVILRSAMGNAIVSHAADTCARVMGLAQGGQILLTRHAYDDGRQYVRQHPPLPEGGDPPRLCWVYHGQYNFKGRDDALEVFEVGANGFAPLTAPPDSEKALRLVDQEEDRAPDLYWFCAAYAEGAKRQMAESLRCDASDIDHPALFARGEG